MPPRCPECLIHVVRNSLQRFQIPVPVRRDNQKALYDGALRHFLRCAAFLMSRESPVRQSVDWTRSALIGRDATDPRHSRAHGCSAIVLQQGLDRHLHALAALET